MSGGCWHSMDAETVAALREKCGHDCSAVGHVEALAADLGRRQADCWCCSIVDDVGLDALIDALATQIAAAEQRGREDNADHGQCYVFGSKALAAREAAVVADLRAKVEALADRWERSDDRGWVSNQADELRDLLQDQP